MGLEEDKITWHSNSKRPRLIGPTVWETEEITGFSNTFDHLFSRVWRGMELQGSQACLVQSGEIKGFGRQRKLQGSQTE